MAAKKSARERANERWGPQRTDRLTEPLRELAAMGRGIKYELPGGIVPAGKDGDL